MNHMPTADPEIPKVFRFADLELDEGRQRVLRCGEELPLPKLSFDFLRVLLEAAPNYVSHKQLKTKVWPGLVIGDKTVTQRAKLLRDVLGDDHDEPRYVGVLRGRGYRIVASVTSVTPPGIGAEQVVTNADAIQPARRARIYRVVPVLALSVAVLPIAWIWQSPSDTDPVVTVAAPSLAVLSFEAPGDDTQPSVGAGFAEAILQRLADTANVSVIAADSSLRLGSRSLPKSEASERLGTDYLLDGTLRQAGEDLLVTATLRDAKTGELLWNGRFQRPESEIVELQEDIVLNALRALPHAGGTAATLPQRKRLTSNVDAYLAYLRGRARLARWTVAGAKDAEREFREAIDLDPEFAAAHASLYEARMRAVDRASGGAAPSAADKFLGPSPLTLAREQDSPLIDRAIELNPSSGAAYFARATWASGVSDARERDFQQGLALDPGNGAGIMAYSEYLDQAGRPQEAGLMLERALAIDPVSPRALFRRVMRKFPIEPSELEASMLKVLEIDPDYQPALQRYAKYRWIFAGDVATGIGTIGRALALDPGNPWLRHTAVAMYLDAGDAESARRLVRESSHPELSGDLLVALYDRDVAAAGAAALKDSAYANGPLESWGVFEALRDWAYANDSIELALDELRARFELPGTSDEKRLQGFRAVPVAAHMLIETGRDSEARQLLTETIQWIDDFHLPYMSTVYALRVKATALVLLGEDELALDALDAAFRSKDYLQWWYTLEQDPIWTRLRHDPRFREIATRARRHAEEQYQSVVALRRQTAAPSSVPSSR